MRGLTSLWAGHWRRDQRGATSILVALSALILFASAAVAVDLGNMWSSRRELITATDAGALSAARLYALDRNGCATEADALVQANAADATTVGCTRSGNSRLGAVTVDAEQPVEFYFAPVIGKTSGQVESSTTAKWGIPTAVSGLRPFGLCVDSNPVIGAFVRNGTVPTGDIEITYGKSQPSACGGATPGNWGLIDFNGGANSSADTVDWVRDGYDGLVSAGTLGRNCAAEPPSPQTCYEGDTGAFSNSLGSAITSLIASGETFALPIFDSVEDPRGANTMFHLVNFIFVKLVAAKTNGAAANRSLTIRVVSGLASGTCCVTDPSVIDTGLRVIKICATDASDRRDC